MDIKDLTLNTSAPIPALGLGTWKSPPGEAGKAVEYALGEAGYRHIDCASFYLNQPEIGEAFEKVFSTMVREREDVFITSKLWNTHHRKEQVRAACEATLRELKLEYLDLYLMHWGIATKPANEDPAADPTESLPQRFDEDGRVVTDRISIRETWEAMEELEDAGLVKAIGVANFGAPMLNDLLSYARIRPAVNQVELHPYLQQQSLVDFCQAHDITVTAYSPLGSPGNSGGKGLPSLTEDETVVRIAEAHQKSPAQVLIRWALQRGTSVIPKSVTPERIMQNIDVYDFELSAEEMDEIRNLDRGLRFVDPSSLWRFPYFS